VVFRSLGYYLGKLERGSVSLRFDLGYCGSFLGWYLDLGKKAVMNEIWTTRFILDTDETISRFGQRSQSRNNHTDIGRQMKATFRRIKWCDRCGKKEISELDQFVAAFQHPNELGNCSSCGSRFSSLSQEAPALNSALMEKWIKNDALLFSQQDEEIIMSGKENFELVLEFLDRPDALCKKKIILIASLCVNIFDNVHPEAEDVDTDLLDRSISEVSKRRELVLEGESMNYILPYIREVVWPLIGLRYSGEE
jgi:hypothetical protein